MKNHAFALAGLFLAAATHATTVQSELRYRTADLDNTSWLVDATLTRSDANLAETAVADFPLIPNGDFPLSHTTYLGGGGWVSADGRMAGNLSMVAGGQLEQVMTWQQNFTNLSGATQAYQLDFQLGPFVADMGGWTADASQRHFSAGFELEVFVNGTRLLQGSQHLVWREGSVQLLSAGAALGSGTLNLPDEDLKAASYTMDPFAGQLALGSFGAGASFDVTYRIRLQALWSDPAGCAYECASVSLDLSDPYGVGGGLAVSAVPEPASSLMLLAGCALLGLSLQSRRRS